MRAFRRRTLWSALVAALAVTGFAGSAQAIGPPAPDPATPSRKGRKPRRRSPATEAEQLKRQDLLLPIANKLAAQARASTSDIAGVSIDPDRGTVHLYRKDPGIPLGHQDAGRRQHRRPRGQVQPQRDERRFQARAR